MLITIQINPFGFGGSNAVVIPDDDTYHFFETIGRYGHHRNVEAPFAANAADSPDTDADCQESHAIAAEQVPSKCLKAHQSYWSYPIKMESDDWAPHFRIF